MNKIKTAVILAAGKSTRTYPLTLDTPKALLKIANQTILSHLLDQLEGIVEQVFIVVRYKKEMIMEALGDKYKSLNIQYVEQEQTNGTGGALQLLKGKLQGRFLVLYGDDLYSGKDIRSLLDYHYALLAQPVADPSLFGILTTETDGRLKNLVEKPKNNVGNLANAGCYLLDEKIFQYDLQPSPRGEYELTDSVLFLANESPVQVVPVQDYWLPIAYPWDVLTANQFFLEHHFTVPGQAPVVPASVTLAGPVSIGSGVTFGKNIKITGPAMIADNVTLEDNVAIEQSVVEQGVVLKKNVSIAHSLIMASSVVEQDSRLQQAIVAPAYTFMVHPKRN